MASFNAGTNRNAQTQQVIKMVRRLATPTAMIRDRVPVSILSSGSPFKWTCTSSKYLLNLVRSVSGLNFNRSLIGKERRHHFECLSYAAHFICNWFVTRNILPSTWESASNHLSVWTRSLTLESIILCLSAVTYFSARREGQMII